MPPPPPQVKRTPGMSLSFGLVRIGFYDDSTVRNINNTRRI